MFQKLGSTLQGWKKEGGTATPVWIIVLCAILAIRILFIGLMGLMPQDAYYQLYGEYLALSYFDHPPVIAYLLRLFTTVLGHEVYVIKLADSFITLLSFLAFYRLATRFLSPRRVVLACVLMLSTLMVSTLSLVSTPDVPLILFWTLTLLTLHDAIFLERKSSWIWAGLMMGCAFDSKYTGLFLPAGLALFLLLSPRYRKLLLSRWFWLSLVLFACTIFPVIWWNWQHDFASFRFQTTGRMAASSGPHFNILGFLGVLAHQSAILMPVLFVAVVGVLYKGIRKFLGARSALSDPLLFLYAFFVPAFLLFLAVSFFSWVKINWLMPSYVSGVLLASMFITRRWVKYQLAFSLVVHLALAVEILFYPIAIKSDDTWFGWQELSQKLTQVRTGYPGSFVFAADDYKTSAVLNFYEDNFIYSRNVIGERALQFDYIETDLAKLKGRDAIFLNSIPGITSKAGAQRFPAELTRYFDSVEELSPIVISNRGVAVRTFLVFHCTNYHPAKNKKTAPVVSAD